MGDFLVTMGDSVPAELAEILGGGEFSSGARSSLPHLVIDGKQFVVKHGELEEPVPAGPSGAIPVVLVAGRKNASKVYYATPYTGEVVPPDCSSVDGVHPDKEVPNPVHHECATCPMNQWGSRKGQKGNDGKACRDYKRIVVAPANPDTGDVGDPHVMKIPVTSITPLGLYHESIKIKSNKRLSVKMVVTDMGFDRTVKHPKLTFEPVRALSPEGMHAVVEMQNDAAVVSALALTCDFNYKTDKDEEQDAPKPEVKRPTYTPRQRQAAKTEQGQDQQEDSGAPDDDSESSDPLAQWAKRRKK